MAKLSDLIDVKRNDETIEIQGVKIPVHLGFSSFEYIAEAYGKSYRQFEHDLNGMLMSGNLVLTQKVVHLMNALVYGMVRAGGTETTPTELGAAIPLEEAGAIYQIVLNVYNRQNFQDKDAAKLVPAKPGPKTQGAKKRRRNRRK